MIFRILCETAVVVAIGFLAGFANNAFSPRSIPLIGSWDKAYGVPSPGGINDVTRGNVEIGLEEALRLKREKALFLDARPAEAYAERHILGAYSLPEDQVSSRLRAVLPLIELRNKVVVYCQSMDCDEGHLLAQALREAGIEKVFVFAGGLKEWEEAGYPLAQPAPAKSSRRLP